MCSELSIQSGEVEQAGIKESLFIKIHNFWSSNDSVKKMKRQATELEKISISKNIRNKNIKYKKKNFYKMNNPILKMKAKDINRHFTSRDICMASKHMK